jgi:sugar lactone lactonase YvrE
VADRAGIAWMVDEPRDRLGESALWHPRLRTLWWIDFYGPTVHRLDPATGLRTDWKVPGSESIGALAFTAAGELVLALDRGLHLFDPATGAARPFADPEAGRAGIGYNDAKVDGTGRFWAGTSDTAEAEPRGVLWRVDAAGRSTLADSGFVVSNGPAFAPDSRTLYFSDTTARRILAYDLDPATGRLSTRRVFATLTLEEGWPDGLAADSEGGVWCARYGGGAVTRFDRDGRRTAEIALPVRAVTSCCLGGGDLRRLFITTGRMPDDAAAEPLAGALFTADVTVPGMPEPLFAPEESGRA